jgi:branched-chain amino acid transport system substrate-binding protein
MRKIVFLGVVTLILLAASTAGCASNVQTGTTQPETVRIGALVPLTGSSASIGANVNSTIHVAEADVNEYLAATNANVRVQLVVKDTGMTPTGAVAAMQALHAEGVTAVVGPYASSPLQAVAPYANDNGMVLISYGSTVPSLGVPRENVFRLVPDDNNQGAALAGVMREQGMSLVIPIVRDDAYGNGLANATRSAFQQQGGVVTEGTRFPVNTTDFSMLLDAVQPQLIQATATHGADSVGVLIVGYESDTLPILVAAGDDPQWSGVHWWGVEATPINAVLANTTAAQSAARLHYTGAQQAEGHGERYDRLTRNTSVNRTVQTSDGAFAYDAVWVMARAIAETNGGNSTALRAAIPRVAGSYEGITGNTTLNAVGDRAYANYDFWTIKSQNDTYVKVKTAEFRTDPRSGIAVVQPGTTGAAN